MADSQDTLKSSVIAIIESSCYISRQFYLIRRLDTLANTLNKRIAMLNSFLDTAKRIGEQNYCIAATYKLLELQRAHYGLVKEKIDVLKQLEEFMHRNQIKLENALESYVQLNIRQMNVKNGRVNTSKNSTRRRKLQNYAPKVKKEINQASQYLNETILEYSSVQDIEEGVQ